MDMQRFQDNAKPSEKQAAQLQQAFKQQCRKAAQSLWEADVFVVITGAGFSADSGLAVYADVARVPAYLKLGVTYEDLCQPHWLSTAPRLFYGFWGQCYNDYRDTPPHAGYQTVARWRDDKNKRNATTTTPTPSVAAQIRKQIARIRQVQAQEDSICVPPFRKDPAYPVQGDPAGAFFCYTSNVDAHWFDVCEAHEIHECHGNVELWQCRHPYTCQSGIWRAPLEHRFRIDQDRMEAPPSTKPSLPSTSSEDEDASDSEDSIDRIFQKLEKKEDRHESAKRRRKRKKKRNKKRAKKRHKRDQAASVPVIGHVLGKGERKELLAHLPASTNRYQWRTTDDNWPQCGKCQDLARPAILMFGDKEWLPDHAQKERWAVWQHSLFLVCQQRQQQKQPIKVCLLEIGCGMNVPTCRVESEQLAGALLEIDGDVALIRVNPDYPLASFPSVGEHTIPIMSRGLKAIDKIDHYYAKLQRKEKRKKNREKNDRSY